jgi:hypothetical protein
LNVPAHSVGSLDPATIVAVWARKDSRSRDISLTQTHGGAIYQQTR